MDPEPTLAQERCTLHPDRAAVGRCERCGRGVCLECAIPFRGGVRCDRCAALELGEPEPVVRPGRAGFRPEHVVLVLLLVALAATVPPWHRSGTLTTMLAAWSIRLDGWAAVGCLAIAASTVAAALLVWRRGGRAALVAAGGGALLATLAIGIALGRAPAFFSTTVAPLLALTCGLAAAGVCAFRLVRGVRP